MSFAQCWTKKCKSSTACDDSCDVTTGVVGKEVAMELSPGDKFGAVQKVTYFAS
jgi:hypothetical protein